MKLFKKVAAAVLAGVMALSMVACAPAGTTPTEEIKTNPTSSTVDQMIEYMNKYSAAKVVDGTFPNAVEFKNELASEAQAVADALAAGKLNKYGTVVDFDAKAKDALKNVMKGNVEYYVLKKTSTAPFWKQIDGSDASIALETYKFDMDKFKAFVQSQYENGWLLNKDTVSTEVKGVASAYKMGFAAKEINGTTIVVMARTKIV